MRVRGARGRRGVAGAAALVALTVTGCSGQSGAAAVVEGRTIPIAELHEATREVGPYLQDAGTPSDILLRLVAEPTFERVAEDHGVVVSDQQVREALERLAERGINPTAEGDEPGFSEGALSVVRLDFLRQGIQGLPDAQAALQQVSEGLTELDVEVNPRFGDIDFSAGGITPVQHPWLVPEPTPEPTAP